MSSLDFNITVIGLGLIGGSFSMALKQLNPKHLWGVDIDEETIKNAENMGIIDKGYTKAEVPLKKSDIVIIALYPEQTIEFVKDNIPYFMPGAIITDTAGIKGRLVQEINSIIPETLDFIGGHPMAGRESRGIGLASADIFTGANYILTPVEKNTKEHIALLEKIIRGIGCHSIIRVSPDMHDEIIAFTSQLPHILAVSLINSGIQGPEASSFAGGSFRDATRVADINSSLWAELLTSNRINIINSIESFEENIKALKDALLRGDIPHITSELEKAGRKRKEMVY